MCCEKCAFVYYSKRVAKGLIQGILVVSSVSLAADNL